MDTLFTTTVDYVYRALVKGNVLKRIDVAWRSKYSALKMWNGKIYSLRGGGIREYSFSSADFLAKDWIVVDKALYMMTPDG